MRHHDVRLPASVAVLGHGNRPDHLCIMLTHQCGERLRVPRARISEHRRYNGRCAVGNAYNIMACLARLDAIYHVWRPQV